MTIHTTQVSDGSPQLDVVKCLWRKDSATLGFFPDGAFAEYAQKGQIVAAERAGEVVGYTLFRRTGTRVAIVHLCVDPGARGKGVARALTEAVSQAAPDADGVSLRCRRDFEADAVWPKLGFRPIREIQGRGKAGGLLTVWFKSHGNEDLFSLAAKKREPRTVAAIDANVFFDLAETEGRAANESRALLADWLNEIVELRITEELFSEIRRADDAEDRRRHLDFAHQFNVLQYGTDDLALAQRVVDEVLPPPRNQRDRSDRAHLAACIAAKVSYFVTRDDLLREYGDALYRRARVSVLRPSDFIADLDEIERADAYRPARLAGTSMRLVPAKEVSEDQLAETFRGQQRRSEFLSVLRSRIAAPRSCVTQVVLAANRPVALLSLERTDNACLRVGLLRTAGDETRTLASYLAHHIRVAALEGGASFVVVDEAGIDADVRAALEDDEFTEAGGQWLRIVCGIIGTRREIRAWAVAARSSAVPAEVVVALDHLEAEGILDDATPASVIERRLWPAKVLDGTLRTFVVPIRPHWAHHLFDAELAKLDLFGAKPHLAMSRENVYYRSPSNPAMLPFPARVLWYVSADDRTPGTKAIRACSRLVEVTVGPPKLVFKAGRRLGIYEWKDVADTANGSRGGLVQALRFCDTECFANPVALADARSAIEALGVVGVNASFPAPQPLSEEAFGVIYRAGVGR